VNGLAGLDKSIIAAYFAPTVYADAATMTKKHVGEALDSNTFAADVATN
jgi:hypothetical protein